MGTSMAPAYANNFMANFEQTHLPNDPFQPTLCKHYMYIDDVLAMFTCADEEIDTFISWINKLHPTIKFTADKKSCGVPLFDTFLTIENAQIRIRPYTKKTDTKEYINPSSCHPPHTIGAIPYLQVLCIKRIQ